MKTKPLFILLQRYEALFVMFGLLVMGCLAYLLIAGNLGFYRDDWYMIWAMKTGGISRLFEMFKADRPFMGLISGVSYKLVGDSTLTWQFYGVFLRILCGWGFLWLIRLIWPKNTIVTFAMAVLFMVYPGFFQQTNAVTFSNHFISYGLSIFSVVFTLLAIRQKRWWLKTVCYLTSMCSAIGYMLIYEYMIGMELVRVLLIIYLQYRAGIVRLWRNAWASFLLWLPSALPVLVFLYWRIFIFKSTRPATNLDRLGALYQIDPLGMGLRLIVETARDFFETVYLAWFVPLYRFVSQMEAKNLTFGAVIGVIGAAILWFYWKIQAGGQSGNKTESDEESWIKEVLVVGTLWTLFAIFPVVLSERQVLFQNMLDRYTLHVTGGVAIVLTACIYLLFNNSKLRFGTLAILVGIGLLSNYGNGLEFSRAWKMQQTAWWQLSWRAPDLSDGTAIVMMLPETYRLSEGYEVWAPANLIYQRDPNTLFVMGDVLNKETLSRVDRQDNIQRSMRSIIVTSDFKNTLVASLNESGCLHIYDRNWRGFSENEDPMVRMISAQSIIDLIHDEADGKELSTKIFGREPDHDWCYLYQKAELATQQKNWEEVLRLGNVADQNGIAPDVGYEFEWMPFYEGYLRLGLLDRAEEAASQIARSEDYLIDFCALFDKTNPAFTAMDEVRLSIGNILCSRPK